MSKFSELIAPGFAVSERRVDQGGGRLPPPSYSVALADPMGLSGNELPPELTWIPISRKLLTHDLAFSQTNARLLHHRWTPEMEKPGSFPRLHKSIGQLLQSDEEFHVLQFVKATLHELNRFGEDRVSVLEDDLHLSALPIQVHAFDAADRAYAGVVIETRPSQIEGTTTLRTTENSTVFSTESEPVTCF
jgi:hypothetical protein